MPTRTDDRLEEAEQWLTRVLAADQRAVTFRELARELGCPVNHAKNLMKSYQAAHSDVSATYLISGPLLETSSLEQTSLTTSDEPSTTQSLAHLSATQKLRIVDMDEMSDDERNSEADAEEQQAELELEASANGDGNGDVKMEDHEAVPEDVPRWGVVLVAQDALESKLELFQPEQVSVHVYALTPAPLKDATLLLANAATLREHKAYADPELYATIAGLSLGEASKPLRDGAMDFGSKTVKSEKTVKKEVKEEAKPQPTAVKRESSVKDERRSSAQPPEKASQASKPSTKSKRRIITSDDEEDEEESQMSTTSTRRGSAKNTLEPTSSMVRAQDQAALEALAAMDDDDMDGDEDLSLPAKQNSSREFCSTPGLQSRAAEKKPTPSTSREGSTPGAKATDNKKRKRKQVKKSKTEMDERGYMVTRDYFTEESCTGSDTETESVPKAAPKSAPKSKPKEPARTSSSSSATSKPASSSKPPSKAPGKKSQMGQSTLAGFFKKK